MRAYLSLFVATLVGCTEPASIVIEPLRVINWSPAAGAFCVGVGATMSATFSDDLNPDSLTAENFYLQDADGVVASTINYDPVTFTAFLEPDELLRFETLYTAFAATGIEGQEQGSLAVVLDNSFITIARNGCTPGVDCSLPSDCPGTQICSNIGICVNECVADKDCFRGTCEGGNCVPSDEPDGGGGGDPFVGPGDTFVGPGDTAGGDPFDPGDTAGGDPFEPGDTAGGDPFDPGDTAGGDPFDPGDTTGGDPFDPGDVSGGD